ncbi:glycosyltransferase family 2 protein [Bacteroides helcogenes]|uniref:Glycosyl transferase family 2 n=1 Tax=Bacteroides helcogenes (strain ATCC 35417 / DSM 20613 / JCM 6297 / CCUG 15421 / P 36-108) TaxID=693979 RepID=E6SW44_BACT6|nr:glycosyltransferase family 2 protein [Bacteroides helcogenes]ADV42569.1 glycosyl transferase family 2 [Bacteroides helcogenes P 36-108]MDY5237670.1 glycosyltransferase family 2 protein [Bacteroides helcogenes]
MKISIVINTYNAEKHLKEVLESVKGFDEILVCDMESTDHTIKIAQEYGCKIVTFEKKNYNIVEPARQFAIEQTSHSWVLVVDADEVVTKELRDYLYANISREDCPDGILIPRKNYFMGKFMHCYYPDHILRFFKKEKTYWPPIIHVSPEVKGTLYKIPPKRKELAFEHLANDLVSDIVRKTNDYTENEVTKKAHKHYTVFALLHRPLFRFFKGYILKQGFRDGVPGFIRACLDGYYQFVMVAKILERQHRKGITAKQR